MSASQFDEFDRRMRRIHRRHTKLSQGYVTQITHDGQVVRKVRKRGSGGTIRGLMMVVVIMLCFKGYLQHELGAETYQQRLNNLQTGNVVERTGAWIMQVDPISQAVALQISSLVR